MWCLYRTSVKARTDRALIEPGVTALCVCVEPRIEVKSVRSCSVLFFRRLLCDVIHSHYLIWLRFEETGKIMEEPNRGRISFEETGKIMEEPNRGRISFEETGKIMEEPNRGRISSVGRAFDCRTGGRRFESRGRTITQGLKMTEK